MPHHHTHVISSSSPEARSKRFALSSLLRLGSAGIQLAGGIIGNQPALIVEATEETVDSLTFGAAAIEARTTKKGLTSRVRNFAITFAVAGSALSTYDAASEMVADRFSFFKSIEGFNISHTDIRAAIGAVAINSVVFAINRKGLNSGKNSDKFAYRDSLRDFVIPSAVLGLSFMKADHLFEYAFEAGGVTYGWYNAIQLWKGWRNTR